MLTLSLGIIFTFILSLPLALRRVEEHIEIFLFGMAVLAVSLSHHLGTEALWTPELLKTALLEPIRLTAATLFFGILFRVLRVPIRRNVVRIEEALGPRLFAAAVIFLLGMLSSVITAIIAALVLCEIVSALSLDKKYETLLTVLACFSIGMGAALTPFGEPLSTVALSKLKSGTQTQDFLFLGRLVGIYLVPGMVLFSVCGAFLRGREVPVRESLTEDFPETYAMIVLRAAKVYLFVVALILLGEGFKPVIKMHIAPLPAGILYWINMSSAILDNATLAAAELDPAMTTEQIRAILLGVVVSGGMLIPGNIPNIIAAPKLGITSRAWAAIGVPIGLVVMTLYYVILLFR